jgi:hypothetical protein
MNKIGKTEIKTKNKSHEFKIKDKAIQETITTLLEDEELYVKLSGEILYVENAELKTLSQYLKYKNNLMEYKDICKLVRDIVYLEKRLEEKNRFRHVCCFIK